MIDHQQPVATIVLDHPECAEVFQRHHIDFCCRGDATVEAAARSQGVDVEALVAELSGAIAGRRAPGGDPRAMSTPQLIAYIVSKHHAYLRKTLPAVRALAAKVGRVHGDHNPKLRDLEAAVIELDDALVPHLDAEEQTLFPALTGSFIDGAMVARELASMVADHLAVAALLDRIGAAADDFAVPDWGCGSYRALFAELRRLDADIRAHVHLENHVLLPRFSAPAS